MTLNKKIFQTVAGCLAGVTLAGALVYYNFIDKAEVSASACYVGQESLDVTLDTYTIEDGKFAVGEEKFTLSEHLDKVVVLNFWATWCGPCIEEIPHFNEFYEENSDKVEMVIINAEPVYSMEKIAGDFLNNPDKAADYGEWPTYACTFAKYDKENDVKSKFLIMTADGARETQGLPVTVVIDKEGIIRYVGEGKLEKNELEAIVLPWME